MSKTNTQIYVIGHVNPDTDSIASATGYAWLLQDQLSDNVIAARAGHLNPQTSWVLNRLGLEAPVYLPDASPRFETIAHRFDTTTPERPLREAWAIANKTGGVAPILNPDGTPHGLVTVLSLFDFLSRLVGSHPRLEETRVAELLDRPCQEACDRNVPQFQASSRIRDSLPRILHAERTEFIVVNEHGAYVGICRQRDALHPPRLRFVLVDHNEPRQAVPALDEADLIEILDHHRLGNPSTHIPIRFTVDVVGSTSTLVSERIQEAGLSAPPPLAGLLLAGLLSDTLILKSPTTTERDHQAAARLSRWAFMGGSPLAGETIQSFGEQLLAAGAGLATRDPAEIVSTDFKLYETTEQKFGISQVEVTSFNQLAEHLESLRKALSDLADSKGLDFAMLMVTDVVRGSSRLLLTKMVPALEVLPYPHQNDGTLHAEGVVSRKKQLLPAVFSALEG
ncbi:MAG: DHH family phosphoesterase [Ardenticatenaceae bacterium]|nr:DHH family phosphoesterase [Ardenticatenaceae bacterium]MCB9446250.1 DHH family phosphoesterase [Ardenticatenaceae bacterium]